MLKACFVLALVAHLWKHTIRSGKDAIQATSKEPCCLFHLFMAKTENATLWSRVKLYAVGHATEIQHSTFIISKPLYYFLFLTYLVLTYVHT